jgi:glycosyl-4,4'-diaponeurosporenoate acyltransferase
VHSATGYAVHRAPDRWFTADTWLTREREWEQRGHRYEQARIRRWKDRVPEAGALFAGGISKRQIPSAADGGMQRLAVETRRAEWGHWLAAAGSVPFVLWNPPALAAVMVVYGIAVNAPFIAIQRYNRLRVSRALARRASAASSARAGTRPPEGRSPAARSRSDLGTTGSSIP